ncbi:DUF4231 domain-containing protein [Sphingomonas arenae]|uniref:DUF4231 domain-containing protein n=1 Tax=Sphingomonas arenae TaxID=2812555 RepID=UPI00196857BA|nr:hypothetical protein [Sphingomonas arenae]
MLGAERGGWGQHVRGANAHPPSPRFGLTVGITGHRAEALPAELLGSIEGRLALGLDLLKDQALAVFEREAAFFTDEEPVFTLVSPLASGIDQMAAAIAHERGWGLQAVLPFEARPYRTDQRHSDDELFDRLLSEARCLLELPGDPQDPVDAYVMAGRATVAHCDLLVAVWDGLPARGRGGTAETVDLALLRGTPILHIPVDPQQEPAFLWAAFDPTVITHVGNRGAGRPANAAELQRVLGALLAPPPSEQERKFVRRFLSERERRGRLRIEYPLMMMLAGAHRLTRQDVSARPALEAIRSEWQGYREDCVERHGVSAPLETLEEAYGWADRLATHFAQTYRSGHVFNFILAAVGVLIGLSSLVLDTAPLPFAVAEFVTVLAVVVNTLVGSRRCWHQRWLDYRQLAERLRPMRSLKLLGIAGPDPPGDAAEPVARRWVDWYAACIWRTLGCPAGRLSRPSVNALAQAVSAREFEPQIAYNLRAAQQAERFDGRLEVFGLGLFMATVLITLATIVALITGADWVNTYSNLTLFLSAGLPAVGTAIFGIRVQGDYGALAARSRNTASLLERISAELRSTDDLPRAADLAEHATRVMLADLGEWRLVNELHELSLG